MLLLSVGERQGLVLLVASTTCTIASADPCIQTLPPIVSARLPRRARRLQSNLTGSETKMLTDQSDELLLAQLGCSLIWSTETAGAIGW